MKQARISRGLRIIDLLLFLLAVAFKGLVDAFVLKNNPNGPLNMVKYIVLFVCICFYMAQIYFKVTRKQKLIFVNEFKSLLFMILIVAIITIYFIFRSEHLDPRTLKEFIYFLIPIVFAFTALNVFSLSDLKFLAKASFLIIGICYIFQIGVSQFTGSNILTVFRNITFAGGNNVASKSIFESNEFSDTIMSLYCFFSYYFRNNKLWTWASFVLVVLANKRLMILFAFIIMALNYLPKRQKIENRVLNKFVWLGAASIFCLFPYLVIYLTRPVVESSIYQRFGINMQDFWMGRDSMVSTILSSSFSSSGLGSTFSFQHSLLEIEGVKFLLELGFVGIVAITFTYWKITKGQFYCLVVMFYNFLNINTSTSIITGTFSWIFYLIIIGCCHYYGNTENNVVSDDLEIERK